MTSPSPTLGEDLDRAQQAGDASAEAALLLQLGDIARDKEEYTLALLLYAQARDAYQRAGDPQGCAEALCALVELYAMLWREGLDKSEMMAQPLGWLLSGDVIAQYEQLGDRQGLARGWTARADLDVMAMFLDGTDLIQLYEQALAVYVQSGDHVGQAQALSRIAYVHKGRSRMVEAEGFFERAIALYEQAGHFEDAVRNILKLADFKRSDPPNHARQALYYKRAIAHYETLNQPIKIAAMLSRLGHLANGDQTYELAVQYFRREVVLHEQYGNNIVHYELAVYNLGHASMAIADYEQAKTCYRRVLSLMDKRQWIRYTDCLLYLGVANARTGDLDTGRLYAQQAFAIGESIDDTEDLRHRIQLRQMWAFTETIHKQPDRARETLREVLAFAAKYPHGHRYTDSVHEQLAMLDKTDPKGTP